MRPRSIESSERFHSNGPSSRPRACNRRLRERGGPRLQAGFHRLLLTSGDGFAGSSQVMKRALPIPFGDGALRRLELHPIHTRTPRCPVAGIEVDTPGILGRARRARQEKDPQAETRDLHAVAPVQDSRGSLQGTCPFGNSAASASTPESPSSCSEIGRLCQKLRGVWATRASREKSLDAQSGIGFLKSVPWNADAA